MLTYKINTTIISQRALNFKRTIPKTPSVYARSSLNTDESNERDKVNEGVEQCVKFMASACVCKKMCRPSSSLVFSYL